MTIKRTWLKDPLTTVNAIPVRVNETLQLAPRPDAMAYDWYTKKVYWTDSVYRHIKVSNMDGSEQRVLYSQGITSPRTLSLDPQNG